MDHRRTLKKESSYALKHHRLKAGALFLTAFFLWLFPLFLEEGLSLLLHLSYFKDSAQTPNNFLDNQLSFGLLPLMISAACFLLSFVLSAPLGPGIRLFYLKLSAGESVCFREVFCFFHGFSQFCRAVWLKTLLFVRKSILAFLLFLPCTLLYAGLPLIRKYPGGSVTFTLLIYLSVILLGIICSGFYLYFSARYFLAEYIWGLYGCKAGDALKMSVRIMKNRKSELFLLRLSLIPFYLSVLFLFPCFWAVPHLEACYARHSRFFMEAYEQEKEVASKKAVVAADKFATREFPCSSSI